MSGSTKGPSGATGIITRERRGATTLWKSVYLELEQDILKGRFPLGSQLPTESELAEQYRVHRHTVRRALHTLRERDLIRIEHGRGSFVRERVVPLPIGRRTRFTAALSDVQDGGTRHTIWVPQSAKRRARSPTSYRSFRVRLSSTLRRSRESRVSLHQSRVQLFPASAVNPSGWTTKPSN